MFRGRAWVNLVSCLITLSVAFVIFSQLHNEEELPAGNQIDWLTTGSQLEDVIQCLNSIRVLNQSEKLSHQQLVFLGDSRIRHLFYNFYQVIARHFHFVLITVLKIKYVSTVRQFFTLRIHRTDN
jgi:hypothetical protein